MNIGQRIKKIRNNLNITQEKLASKLFVTDKTVSSWELNRTEPNLEMIIKISEVLDCSIGYLIYGDEKQNDIETEIKIKITKSEYERLKKILLTKAKFIKSNRQIDTYFEPNYRKFLTDNEINEWLRIGKRGNKTILNYKNWHDNLYCDEYEVEISNEENLLKIFNVLGLKKIAVVDKQREIFNYLDKYEISLDIVKELGYFIEIEVKKYTLKTIDEYNQLLKLAKSLSLNLNNIDKRGYPYHIIYKNFK